MQLHAICLVAALLAGCAAGHHAAPERAGETRTATMPPLTVSSQRPFQELLDEATARMHSGMESAPRTGDPDRDFVTQMIPHHQGAIDMARVLLVHGKDPALQRLAKEIITDQQSEIDVMRAWLDGQARRAPHADAPRQERP